MLDHAKAQRSQRVDAAPTGLRFSRNSYQGLRPSLPYAAPLGLGRWWLVGDVSREGAKFAKDDRRFLAGLMPPLQGSDSLGTVTRANALRFHMSPRWGWGRY